jgi:preprotein translocase subunit SecG
MFLYKLILTFHVIVCVALIIVVLLQSSKGGGLAGAFGGGGSQTIFGGQETATFLSKATTYLAVLFMVLSLSLAFLTSKSRETARPRRASRQTSNAGREEIPRQGNIDQMLGSAELDTVSADSSK